MGTEGRQWRLARGGAAFPRVRLAQLIQINGWKLRSCHTAPMDSNDHLPGEPARHTGEYQELNVFGASTGRSVYADEGKPLPKLPLGFMWRHVPTLEC